MPTRKASTKDNNPSSYPSSDLEEQAVEQRAKPGRRPRFSRYLSGSVGVKVAALLTAGMGLVNLFAAVTPAQSSRLRLLETFSPLQVSREGHLASALAGFALLLLASALWRRKRVAWLLTVVVLFISMAVHVLKGLDYEEAAMAAALILLLLLWRPWFHARSDPPSIRQAFVTMLAALAFTLAYGTLGFFLLDRHFRVHFGFGPAIRQTVVMFTQYYDPGLQPVTGFGRYFADSIYLVGMTTTAYALLLLIRPVLARHGASEADRMRAGSIAASQARTSLTPLTLLDDKMFYFSQGGSYVSYVVKGRAALALGDPVGPRCDAEATIAGFKAFCSLNDWFSVYYQVDDVNLDLYERLGFRSLCIGQEAIVDLPGFSLEGGEKKNIRTSVNKMRRLGYSAEVLRPPHSATLLGQLHEVSDDWLSDRGTAEMRFSVGWFDELYLNRYPVVVVSNPQGEIEAFANVLVEDQIKEVAVDLMRQRKAAEKGQMDFIFASLICWARDQGYDRFSFGLSALSGIGERPSDPAVEKALRFVYEHVGQVYNFKGLHAYKSKFGPTWYPRYLIYPDVSTLPATASALIRANTGDDLLGGYVFHPN